MNIEQLAWIHAALCGFVVLFHISLILGAPWGHLTQGGGTKGALPVAGRVAAGASALCLAGIAAVILSVAGVGPSVPRWTAYVSLSFITLGMIANLITPSRAERRLWAPVTICMFGLQGAILLGAFQGDVP
jgi:hypothetical protein